MHKTLVVQKMMDKNGVNVPTTTFRIPSPPFDCSSFYTFSLAEVVLVSHSAPWQPPLCSRVQRNSCCSARSGTLAADRPSVGNVQEPICAPLRIKQIMCDALLSPTRLRTKGQVQCSILRSTGSDIFRY